MWIITCVLLAAYGGLSGATDVCKKGQQAFCIPTEPEPVDFPPENIEALDKICPLMIARIGCMLEYKNKCGIQNPGTVDERLEQIQELLLDMCNKDSKLHQDLADGLPCLIGVINNYRNSCLPLVKDAMDAIRTRYILENGEIGSADDEQMRRKYSCLYEAVDFACLAGDAGVTCGTTVKELVLTILDRVGYLEIVCGGDIVEEVKEMVAVIQLELEENLAARKLLPKA